MHRRLGGLQNRSERGGEEKKSHPCPYRELDPGRSARSLYLLKLYTFSTEKQGNLPAYILVPIYKPTKSKISLLSSFYFSVISLSESWVQVLIDPDGLPMNKTESGQALCGLYLM
jgi:hypothetical protein